MAAADPLDCALDLMRRLPPQDVEKNLKKLIDLAPELAEDLLSAVDQPLRVAKDAKTGRDYLLCDYNRDGDSYRSPWSNEYDPPLADGTQPSAQLRKMEVAANAAFDTYRELYFEGGVSSVYMWDLQDGFAAVILIKKTADDAGSSGFKGSWDSIHVVEVQVPQGAARSATYKLTSTVLLYLNTEREKLGKLNLGGSLTRQVEQESALEAIGAGQDAVNAAHVANIGRMVEDMELRMRNSLQDIYFGKSKDIVNDLRSTVSLKEAAKQRNLASELTRKLAARQATGS
ncbi:CapZ-beta [Hyaloraphidium curvatum]|nr:CapZ-beta [Hyaloraphidium curvatum]